MKNAFGEELEIGQYYWIDYSNYRGPAKLNKVYEHREDPYALMWDYHSAFGAEFMTKDVRKKIDFVPDRKELLQRFLDGDNSEEMLAVMRILVKFDLTRKMTQKDLEKLLEIHTKVNGGIKNV